MYKKFKSTQNRSSYFGLIEEAMELSRILLISSGLWLWSINIGYTVNSRFKKGVNLQIHLHKTFFRRTVNEIQFINFVKSNTIQRKNWVA